MHQSKKIKLAFTYLVKQDTATWEETTISLSLLHANILRRLKVSYSIILFTEGKPPPGIQKNLDSLMAKMTVKPIYKQINLREYVNRTESENNLDFPNPSNCKYFFSAGYRDMCQFFSLDVLDDAIYDDATYFVRVDTDSFFLDVSKKLIRELSSLNCDYAFLKNTVQIEDKAVSVGFGHHLYHYVSTSHSPSLYSNDWESICQQATMAPLMYYTNFEIVRIDWARSSSHRELIQSIKSSEGIYKYRWGDNIIRYYAIHLLSATKKELTGALYKHSGIYDSRKLIRFLLSKLYLALTGKAHFNNFEKDFSILDQLFIGLNK